MVVYDITNESSFKSCSKWLQDIDQVSNDEKSVCT